MKDYNYRTNTYTSSTGETFRAVYCPELDEMAIETAGDIICTETDTIEDVLAGTPWADNETLDFADEWDALEDVDELNSAGLRGWIGVKEE